MKFKTLIAGLIFSGVVMAGSEPKFYEISALDLLSDELEVQLQTPELSANPLNSQAVKQQMGLLEKELNSHIAEYPKYDFSKWTRVLKAAQTALKQG